MSFATTYTGLLMYRTYVLFPRTRSYVDLLHALIGPRARKYAAATVYLLVFLVMCGAIVGSTASWGKLASDTCQSMWAVVATGTIFVLGQAQSMHKLSTLSLVAFLMILLPLVIIFAELKSMVREPEYPPGGHVQVGSNLRGMVVAISDIFFAFAGLPSPLLVINTLT